ncbi:MAG: VOC family protein [Xanthomonadales bacterium]|nr:VOC family protein [Gammaproteobacteria bacterium]MBT8054011.1 VOC family protein [Gammaproteobacteria bacterium]NND56979.1 VOC family protein [Xanthomonadales bacterium]NNK51937.1 VOC family protein [Xanthomonadales bacterium]
MKYTVNHRLGFALAACFYLLVPAFAAAAATGPEPVAPITDQPTQDWKPGKVVWMDLVTGDLRRAGAFYQAVFGWNIAYSKDGTFADVRYENQPVATLSQYEDDQVPDGQARWLVSISVDDVKMAVELVSAAGGKVLEWPVELAGRGRYALVEDSRGAMFMLLHATEGDPPDEPSSSNQWLWAELWTENPAEDAAFYERVIGYSSSIVKDNSGDEILVLGRDQLARSSVVPIQLEGVKPNWLPYLRIADMEATVRVLEKSGGQVLAGPMTDSEGSTVAVVADPTGGVFAIQQRGELK